MRVCMYTYIQYIYFKMIFCSRHTVSKCLNRFKLTLIKAELVKWVLDLINCVYHRLHVIVFLCYRYEKNLILIT